MTAVVLEQPGRFGLMEQPEPLPGPGEALVAVMRIGVCGTDWHAFAGRQPFFQYPRILGHELGVEVLALGPDGQNGLRIGDHCAVEPYLNNPDSQASRRGKTNCCEELQCLGVHCDGGMRPRIVVPAGKLHKSAKLSFDELALVETLCIGAHGVERASPRRDDRVLIVGAGPIGLSAWEFARLASDDVTLMDVSPDRLRLARELLGVEKTALADEAVSLPAFSLVIDATGNKQSMEQAFARAANGGTVVFLGLFQGEVTFHDPEFHRKELSLLASRNAPASTFREVIDRLERGLLDVTPWITHRLSLSEVPKKLPLLAGRPSLLKAMIAQTD